MYSAEVVQEVLQRRRQPWKRAEWLPSEVDNDQLRAVIEADPLTATRSSSSHKKLLKNSKLTILRSFSIWSTFTRWKSLISGCLMSQVQKKTQKPSFWSVLLFCATSANHFSIILWHVKKSGLYTIENDQLSSWTKKLQSTYQSQTNTQKRSWSLFGSLLPIWSTVSKQNHYIWEVCSANWWDAMKTLLQPGGGRKCFPGAFWILKHRFLCYMNKQTYFSLAKMC